MSSGGVRAKRKAARPGEIIEAAFSEFVEKGYDSTRLEDVARRLNVTKGTIYFYFKNKEELFRSVIAQYASDARRTLSGEPVEETSDAGRRLGEQLGFYYDCVVKDDRLPDLLGLMIKEGPRFPDALDLLFLVLVEPMKAEFSTIIEDGVKSGRFRNNARGDYVSEIAMAPILWLAITSLLHKKLPEAEVRKALGTHVDLLLNGLSPR